ncbi:hypothetical protein [Sphingomonas sp. GM_Shp_1]|uniref:hypothetical protein n=1 Tax=Sphingomonas sp. GM_Shp_1 TaxID=2937381 RepID=UPI00226B066B|nr:hypothetical protein [Sphingomonas sp. GM_Shp_1]
MAGSVQLLWPDAGELIARQTANAEAKWTPKALVISQAALAQGLPASGKNVLPENFA